jgi:hypothetical protein
MANTDKELRRELGSEREELVDAVKTLRSEYSRATDVSGKLRANWPAFAAGTLGLGFVASGGIRRTFRLLTRRGR